VLGDPDKRRKYDELGANWRQYEQAQQQGRPGPFDDGAWTVNVGGAEGGFRTMTEDEMRRISAIQTPSRISSTRSSAAPHPSPRAGRPARAADRGPDGAGTSSRTWS